MSALSTGITVLSLLLLLHAAYSAHEFSHYVKYLIGRNDTLPIDIVVEAIVATALFSFAQVISARKLQPISFSKWAKNMEFEGRSPFAFLERRPGFLDVGKARESYKSLVKT
ncbi:magnesium transporter [Lipomyces oligophaga]|uniref:magnesium transporter n=1 Tax=Lipomyces oligophaga TaxID=45792 RepID=UPI0034CF4E72